MPLLKHEPAPISQAIKLHTWEIHKVLESSSVLTRLLDATCDHATYFRIMLHFFRLLKPLSEQVYTLQVSQKNEYWLPEFFLDNLRHELDLYCRNNNLSLQHDFVSIDIRSLYDAWNTSASLMGLSYVIHGSMLGAKKTHSTLVTNKELNKHIDLNYYPAIVNYAFKWPTWLREFDNRFESGDLIKPTDYACAIEVAIQLFELFKLWLSPALFEDCQKTETPLSFKLKFLTSGKLDLELFS